jgi:putative hydrolase of the HAD superfamily
VGIEAVLFDIGGVLEIVEEPVWTTPWGYPSIDALDTTHGLVVSEDYTLGYRTEADLRAIYAGALGLDAAGADAFMAAMWDWYCGSLDEPLMRWARELTVTHRVGILSNSVDGARREEESRYAFSEVFDPIAYSHEIHLSKPDPRAFRHVCDLWGLEPGQVVFIDDVPENVDAASAMGMAAFLHRGDTVATITAVDTLLARQA